MLEKIFSGVEKEMEETRKSIERDCRDTHVQPEDCCDVVPSEIEDTDTSDLL